MKTVDSDNENNSCLNLCNGKEEVTDLLIDNSRGQNLIKCNPDLAESYDLLKSTPMGLKGRFYQHILSKNGSVSQDTRTQSLPYSLHDGKQYNGNLDVQVSYDTNSKLLAEQDSPPNSPTHELWFKTWPERCEKIKSTDTSPDNSICNNTNSLSNTRSSNNCDIKMTNGNATKLTLNEALANISLAYSPVTRQLHFMQPEKNDIRINNQEIDTIEETVCSKGHKRNNPGSYSSTVSSLSDPSPSGSLLESEDRSSDNGSENGTKSKRKGFPNIFNRNMFGSWRSAYSTPAATSAVWKLFTKSPNDLNVPASPQHDVVSSAALIQHARPSNLPAKAEEEELRHREEYKAILAAAKKKEAQSTAAKQKQQKIQLQIEEQQACSTKHFLQSVLPNWDNMYNTRKTRDLWWQGLPSSVRGKVWRLAIGNDLNITQQLYDICLSRAQNRLNSPEPPVCDSDIDQESSMDVIQLDISRTFPNLCIFQEGGPYSDVLHSLLAAYVCYRPDVGYVQGMSFIAAILILNMEQFDAFVCFANLLNKPLHLAAFTLNQTQMQAYYNAYNEIFNCNLPKLFAHFENSGLTPDLYLLDWIYTVFAKAMPLDIACRVWDVFLRDGDEFLFRTALGILHLNQELLLQMDFLHGAQFLTRLPDDLSSDQLFKSIQTVSTNIGKQTFNQIVDKCSTTLNDS